MKITKRSASELDKRNIIINWHKRHFKQVLTMNYEALLYLIDIEITLNKLEDEGKIYHPNLKFIEARMKIFDMIFENLTEEGQEFLKKMTRENMIK